jgi:predicted nucleotidyltransferase component of viral defense system
MKQKKKYHSAAALRTAPKIPAISTEQQFAEKIHSYTLPRETENSRAKDLIDLILLIEKCKLDPDRLRDAVLKTFHRRKTHEIPNQLKNPPEAWIERYKKIAAECGISDDMYSAIRKVSELYNPIITQK